MSQNVNAQVHAEQARDWQRVTAGWNSLTGAYNLIDVDSAGLIGSRQYVWNTVDLAWYAAGVSGHEGDLPSGGGGTTTQYRVITDEPDANTLYVGEALPGTSTSAASWRIKKFVTSGTEFIGGYADGVSTFTKQWSARTGYTYS